jgi:Fur family peroxide stress response transcriptional regulator
MDIERLSNVLRAHGQKVTAQRLHVYQALQNRTDHPTADEVFGTVREILPTISLATVYKVLNELVDLGEVRLVETGDGPTRFDPDTGQHIHLRCVSCGELLDLPVEMAPIRLPDTAEGYSIFRYNLTLEGRCPACQARLTADA